MNNLKKWLLDHVPLLEEGRKFVYRIKPYKAKFEGYYHSPGWNCGESKSGPGSTLENTAVLRAALPGLFAKYGIGSVVDVPCGDFNWMQHVPLAGVDYQGLDIVETLIAENTRRFGRDGIRFGCLDMMKTPPPAADLVICRDCLFHYTNDFAVRGLESLCASGSRYLLTTTFPDVAENKELYAIGWFRPLNLQAPPFSLPPPLELIVEEADRKKCMGLWRIEDVKAAVIQKSQC